MVICLFFIDIKNKHKAVAMNNDKSKLATTTHSGAQTMQTDDSIIILTQVIMVATWALFHSMGIF